MKMICLMLVLTLQMNCTTLTSGDLIGQEEYAASQFWFSDYEYAHAAKEFPDGEQGGFLTTLEKGYLSLLAGTPDIASLRTVANNLESRRMVKASTEAASFLYKETEDRYFPAEHEAILLHAITGLSYAAEGRRAEARIEAKRASIYLEQQFGRDNNFDDPFLRMLVAALFIYAGEWPEAQVDFRIAEKLMPAWQDLKRWTHTPKPPRDLVIVFSGNGAEATNAVGDLGVEFTANKPRPAKIYLNNKLAPEVVHHHDQWYKRHLVRDRAIKHILDQTKRSIDSAGSHSMATVVAASGFVTGVTIAVVGISAGVLVAWAAGGSEGGAYAGLALAAGGYLTGQKVIDSTNEDAINIVKRGDGRARYYRFLRFFPQASQFAISDKPSQAVVKSPTGRIIKPFLTLGEGTETRIRFYHVSGESGAQMATKKLPRYWQHKDQYWLLGTDKTNSYSTSYLCDTIKKEDNFRIKKPDRKMLLQALNLGIASEARNPVFAKELKKMKWIWCGGDDGCYRCSIDGGYEKYPCEEVGAGVMCVLEPKSS